MMDFNKHLKAGLQYVIKLNNRLKAHQLAAFSGQMAYFFVLSFFPLLIFSLSIMSRLNFSYDFILEMLTEMLPANINEMIMDFVSQTFSAQGTTVLSLSGITMLYSASRAVNALKRAINMSYEVEESRNFFAVKLVGMLYTLMFILILVLSVMVPNLAKSILEGLSNIFLFDVNENLLTFLHFLRNAVLLSTFVVVIVSIYAFLPNKKMHLNDIYPGALFSIVGFTTTNYIFSTVVVKLTDYSILYGSLSAIIAFMIWIYLLSNIIIIGAEINALHMLKRVSKEHNTMS